jgi:hypothetical protein
LRVEEICDVGPIQVWRDVARDRSHARREIGIEFGAQRAGADDEDEGCEGTETDG